MKTPLVYYGGKQWLVPELLTLIPDHRQYLEPFFGGGSLFWAKPKSDIELINDINGNIVNFMIVLRDSFPELKHYIDHTLYSKGMYKAAWDIYKHPDQHDPVTRAWAMWVQSSMSFSGEPGAGFSIGYNKNDKAHHGRVFAVKREIFTKIYQQRLREVQIDQRDVFNFIDQLDRRPDDFWYFDPPYEGADQGHYHNLFEDHLGLIERLASLKGKFLLSYYKFPELMAAIMKYGWDYKEYPIKINVKNKNRIEILTGNFTMTKQGKFF